ncbi:ABC transporter substrate-binding protein [Aliibacillus thermotolerans]|uniref:ABC transporter substrate-binding protein n=1 Tax=Aliibacillus thermotolerans TaxID=1834418 RepID=A0ABW0U4T0_9BACI|nr:ABC transporter substrate-binding protein [Aliibacillus thermotolerans]
MMNKPIVNFLIISLMSVVLILSGCSNESAETDTSKKQENTSHEATNTLNLEYSDSFSIEYIDGQVKKLVDGEGRSFLLVPKGEEVPEGYDDVPVIYTPIENVLASSSTQVSLMEPLGVIDSLSAVMTDKDDWYLDDVIEGFENGSITFVGTGQTPDYEFIQEINPDIAIVYGGTWGQFEIMEKLDELGITYVVNNEYLEEHPFARMEWIKFLAALYNKEEEAEQFFTKAVNNVESLFSQLPDEDKTSVVWANIYDGQFSVVNPKGFTAKLMDMAGGNYIFKDLPVEVSESVSFTQEEFYAQSIEADVFIYDGMESYVGSLDNIVAQAPLIADMKSVQDGDVWLYQDWYWQMLHKTDEIIEDLAIIFYPELFPDQTPKHFIKAE